MGYIYLIYTFDCLNAGVNIYKIGRTNRHYNNRISEYKNGSITYLIINTSDCKLAEKILLKIFKAKYIQRLDHGNEYFEGNVYDMVKDIFDYMNQYNIKYDEIKQPISQNKIEISVKKQKSNLNDIILYETIDIDLLNNLINSDILQNINDKKNKILFDNNKSHLITYAKQYIKTKKQIKVKYKITKINYGRVTAIKGLSLGSIKREIRHILSNENYVDIDIVNAHPSIIEQICITNNINCIYLTKYIKDRNNILQTIMKIYNVNKEQAKELFIRIMYGGTFESWAKDNDINEKPIKYITDFMSEFNNITNIIIKFNNELDGCVRKYKESNNEKYQKGCSLSYYAQEYERRILEIVFNYLVEKKYIIDNNCVLCFDGIMIPKDNYRIEILSELSNEVYDKIGFNLIFENKEMDKTLYNELLIEINNKNKIDIDQSKLEYLDEEYFISLPSYNAKKVYWEYFCCKIILPEPHYIITQNNINQKKYIDIINDKNLISSFRHLVYESEKDGEIKEEEFIKKWIKDKNIRHYERIEFNPINASKIIQDNRFYNLFEGWNTAINIFYDKTKSELALKSFKELGIALCNDNESYFNYLMKFFAHMIQKPNERIPIAFIIKGKQGSGKNVFLNAICNILDRKNFIVSSNSNDFFGTYAEGFYHKLLVNLNECEGRDNFQYEGKIKSFITEDTLTINPKFVRPTTINNYARLIIFTNKANPVPIDVKSIDRRFVVYETSNKYLDHKKYNNDFWKILVEQFNKLQFIACLYDYLNTIDISNWNFKNERPITPAYLEMCRLYIPIEAIYFESFIEQKKYITYKNNEDKNIYINGFTIYTEFIKWASENGFHKEYKPSIISFYSKIIELDLAIYKVKIDGYINLKFKPSEVYKKLIDKRWLSIMMDENNENNNNEIIDYSHLVVF
jgi:hypothetical protein